MNQQRADALTELLTDGAGTVNTEVIVHVRGDGTTMNDGTPIPSTVVASRRDRLIQSSRPLLAIDDLRRLRPVL